MRSTEVKFSHLKALVDVSAVIVCLQGETLRTDTVPVTGAGEDALLVLGAWVGTGAVAAKLNAKVALPNEGRFAATGGSPVDVVDAGSISRTLLITGAGHLFRVANSVGIAGETSRTVASKAAVDVCAVRVSATR